EFAQVRFIANGAHPNSQVRARELAVLDNLVGNLFRQAAGDGETDAAVQALNESIDADDLAFDVDQRPSAVARVDQRIGLNEILVHGHSFERVNHGASLGTDVAKGHAIIEPEGRADGDGKLADLRLAGIGQYGCRQVLRINLDDRNVRLWIHPADRGFVLFAILEPNPNCFRVFDDMTVGENVTIRPYDNARTLADTLLDWRMLELFVKFSPEPRRSWIGGILFVIVDAGRQLLLLDADDHNAGGNPAGDVDKSPVELANDVKITGGAGRGLCTCGTKSCQHGGPEHRQKGPSDSRHAIRVNPVG